MIPPSINIGAKQLVLTSVIAALAPIIFSKRLRCWVGSHFARWKIAKISSEAEKLPPTAKVSALYIYPVKSLRAVSLNTVKIEPLGLQNDRRFMVVRPCPPSLSDPTPKYTHRFLTQRQAPSLATISAFIDHEKNQTLTLKCGDDKHVTIPISEKHLSSLKTQYRAGIWEDVITVADLGDEVAAFIQSVTQNDDITYNDARLVSFLSSQSDRNTKEQYVPLAAMQSGTVPKVAFPDGFPILITCETSLDELNRRLERNNKSKLPMTRFRPNIVLKGTTAPFEEDEWKAIRIGTNVLHIVKGCPRCKQSCTDQKTGKRGEEPLETLAEFRACGKSDVDVYFGQNVVVQEGSGDGVIRVGDEVRVLTRGDPVWDEEDVKAE